MTESSFIASKIKAIKNQYGNGNQFEIDMIGHSMGSYLIQNTINDGLDVRIRRAITIGTPFSSMQTASKVMEAFDIIGTKDCLIHQKSVLPQNHQIRINAGHLVLLLHREGVNSLVKLLA